jgi:hypothetical protein
MALKKSALFLEFNELCPDLMRRFIEQGELPNFKRLLDQSIEYTTNADEEQEHLEPWIQWVTVHTGVGYDEHQIFNLGDAQKLRYDAVWDLLSREGHTVGVCGSMNVKYSPDIKGFVLPDAWSSDIKASPDDLNTFFRFIQVNVQEHTNKKVPLSRSDYQKFFSYMVSHGFSLSTMLSIAKQIIGEKLSNEGRWKRAVLLDKLQWDLFAWHFKRYRPSFSTFFVNSTAHLQHKFWRNMDPEKFRIKPSEQEQRDYGEAILFGYREMDKLIEKAFELAGEETTILFSTALSQQPYLKMEEAGGKRFYRPHDFQKFVSFLGLSGVKEVAPVMSEQFHLYFESEEAAKEAEQILRKIRILGNDSATRKNESFTVQRKGNDVFTGCIVFDQVSQDAMIEVEGTDRKKRFSELFYQADGVKSGMHHPDGIFWVQTPERKHYRVSKKVSIRALAPTLLSFFGVDAPAYMKAAPLPMTYSDAQQGKIEAARAA